MTTSHERDRAAFQGDLDALQDGETLQLVPREFPGPVVFSQAATLDGQGATIWALRGPVLTIAANGVVLRNLKIEVTGEELGDGPEAGSAILVRSRANLVLDNVEVRGSVIGLREEAGEWHYPHSLQIGQLVHGKDHRCLLRIAVPIPCSIHSTISGLEIAPRSLTPGPNELRLNIERLPADTLLNGRIYLTSAYLKRWIMVSAHIVPSAAERTNPVVWEPPNWASLASGTYVPPPAPLEEPAAVAAAPSRPVRRSPPPPPPAPVAEPSPPAPTAAVTQPSPPIPKPPPVSPPPVTPPTPAPAPASGQPKLSPSYRRVQGSLLGKLFAAAAETAPPSGKSTSEPNAAPGSSQPEVQPEVEETPKPESPPAGTTAESAGRSRKVVRGNKLPPLFGGGTNPLGDKKSS